MDDQEMINTLRDIADRLEAESAKKVSIWYLTFRMATVAKAIGESALIEAEGSGYQTKSHDLFLILSDIEKIYR